MITYRRQKLGEVSIPHAFGPRPVTHEGDMCPACGEPIVIGDYTTLIPLGPGDNEEDRERAREGRWFNAISIEVHYACATGSPASLRDAVQSEEKS